MTFTVQADGKLKEYYERRGCKVKVGTDNKMAIMIPYMCPELKIGGAGAFCRIYDKRPQVCREYDGRWDPHMAEYCQLPKDEVIQVSTPDGPNPFYQCPFCGQLDPGELLCSSCGKLMEPPEDFYE
jgi:Fe-S-cluster containining protein